MSGRVQNSQSMEACLKKWKCLLPQFFYCTLYADIELLYFTTNSKIVKTENNNI